MSLIVPPSLQVAIVDLYLRRATEDRPAIGILMGFKSDFGGEIQVRSCYPLPSGTGTENVELSVKIPSDLHRVAFPKDQLIGWFSTNSKACAVIEISQSLRDLAAKECGGNAIELEMHLEPSEAVSFRATNHLSGASSEISCVVECSLGEWNVCRQLYEGQIGAQEKGCVLPQSGELHRQALEVISKLTGQ
jgi:hypothetical protein